MVRPNKIPRPSVLVSNSALYFASRLLEGTLPVNAMTVFNLATFCEAIALGEVIYTLPPLQVGGSNVLGELNRRGLLREVPVDCRLGPALSASRTPSSYFDRNQELGAATILSHVLPFSPDELKPILARASEYTDKNWSTPDWNDVRSWFGASSNDESSDHPFKLGLEGLKQLGSGDIGDSLEDLVCGIYSRTGIYMQASSLYRLTLLADSFRTDLVKEFNRDLHTRFSGLIDNLIASVDIPESEKNRLLNRGFSYEEYDVVVPSFLALALRDCNSREVFLDSALSLRRDAKHMRSRIGGVERAHESNAKDRKALLIQATNEYSEDKGKGQKESLTFQAVRELGITPDRLLKLGLVASIAIFNHFKNRHLTIVHDLRARIQAVASINDDLERVFKAHLSQTERQLLQSLLEGRWSQP